MVNQTNFSVLGDSFKAFYLWFCLFLAAILSGFSGQAHAQAGPYENTTSTPFNETLYRCGTANLDVQIDVTDSFIIGDVDLGMVVEHTYRGDIRATLIGPTGISTSVSLVTPDGGNGLANYDVRFDDAAGNDINQNPHNTADVVSAPHYQNDVRPLVDNMSDFNGQNAFGIWTLELCDNFNADSGDFRRAELFFVEATEADLDLVITANDTTPDLGTNVVLTYSVSNAGIDTDGVSATITLPSGLSYVSDNGGTAFNDATGVWTVPGSISGGTSETLEITAFVESSGTYATSAEITTSNVPDPDSTPGNGITTEDDFDILTLVPVTPPVPSLLCPGAASVVDWDTQVWPTGTTNNTYTVDGEDINLTVTAAAGILLNNATFGGQSPAEQTTFTGGYVPVQSNVGVLADQPNQASTVGIDFTLGTAGTGVQKFQITLFDIDFGTAQFQDRITIAGSLGGSSVSATYITGSSYTMSGDVATGTVASNSNVGNGNLTIEFDNPVDTVNITYGNGTGAPANPGQQGIGIHDIFFCPSIPPAVLTASKTTAVYDPLSEGLYAIPGNDVIYTIEFTNTGDGDADPDSVVIIDAMPPEIAFYTGDIDDGGPFTDPVVGIDNGTGLSLVYGDDVRFSKSITRPASFAECTDPLSGVYDGDVNFLCVNPSGAMAAGDPDPSFQIQFRARIK